MDYKFPSINYSLIDLINLNFIQDYFFIHFNYFQNITNSIHLNFCSPGFEKDLMVEH